MDENARQKLALALLGSGMAKSAADDKQIHPLYQEHVIDAQTNGQQPMTYEQFAQQYRQRSQ